MSINNKIADSFWPDKGSIAFDLKKLGDSKIAISAEREGPGGIDLQTSPAPKANISNIVSDLLGGHISRQKTNDDTAKSNIGEGYSSAGEDINKAWNRFRNNDQGSEGNL